jgi:hypothetical protein
VFDEIPLVNRYCFLKESPSVNDAVVLSSAQFGAMPEQRLRFIPIYFAGAIGN